MTDDNIANILILLKTYPDKFYEKNYDKETLKKIKEIIKSADILYGKESYYLKNKYYNYMNDYFLEKVPSLEVKDINKLKKIVYGFFYKAEAVDLMSAFESAPQLIRNSFKQIDETKEIGTKEAMIKLLEKAGINVMTTVTMYHLTELYGDKEHSLNLILNLNAAIFNQLTEELNIPNSKINEVADYLEMVGKKVYTGDSLIYETTYALILADFCTRKKMPTLNPNYHKGIDNRKIIMQSVNVQELARDVNSFYERYSNGRIIQTYDVCDELDNLNLPEKVEEYSLYDSLAFLTNVTISKIRNKSNLELENVLLENLILAKASLNYKSKNQKLKTKVKKII